MKTLFMAIAMAGLAACNDEQPSGKGQVEFELTDAPSDDPAVEGVFITVADVKVDGHSLPGFTRQTIDLKAYSEGKTKLLGAGTLDARTYDHVELVLDPGTDADGASPGCYVRASDNTKHQLRTDASGTMSIVVSKSWSVAKNAKTKIVLDFDLRKALRYSENSTSMYDFVSDSELNAAVRLIDRANSGTLNGSYHENTAAGADKVIVYAYRKGTFDADAEVNPPGEDRLAFANAVGSAEVKEGLTGGTFTLAFLEEGEYELHFAAYTRDSASGRFVFHTSLKSEITADGSTQEFVSVKNGATINVSAIITGLL